MVGIYLYRYKKVTSVCTHRFKNTASMLHTLLKESLFFSLKHSNKFVSRTKFNLSPHPSVTSHTAACCHIVLASLSMSLSSPCATCANLSSHRARPPGCRLSVVSGHDCGAEWWIKAVLSRSRKPLDSDLFWPIRQLTATRLHSLDHCF